jgi:ABC-type glycerol-3-phosphate transport system substrate-binding protein
VATHLALRAIMPFPFGKPILVMLIAAAFSGVLVLWHPPTPKPDLTIWTFETDRGYELDPSILQSYEARTGLKISVKVLSTRGLDTRLISLFMHSANDAESPDVVEVEIGSVGKFFRPPTEDVGFLPWNDYLDRHGLRGQLSAARMAVWSKDGQIFGLPQDVHPISLTYRKDLFDAAGVDPMVARTWPELQALCLKFEAYWRAHGEPRRHAMELDTHGSTFLNMMLQQRHINPLDAEGHIFLARPEVAQTLAFYSGLMVGPGEIAGDANPGDTRWMNDVSEGDLCMAFTPDWRSCDLRLLTPDLRGKLAMMPLPRFDPDDAPTASWGGTMMAVPRTCRHPEEALALAAYLTTNPAVFAANKLAGFDLIPPLPGRWSDPMYHQPDPYYAGNQSVDDLYVRLARQLPPRYVTPFTAVAETELSDAVSRAVEYRRDHGDAELLEQCQKWLDDDAVDLQRRIQFGTFSK